MTAPYIVAIDPATSTGVCHGRVGSTPTLLELRFRHGKQTDEDLYGTATCFFAAFLKTRSPDLIAIEAPIQAAWGKTNAGATSITRGLYAIFTGITKCKGIPLLTAEIATWRKYAIGHGHLPGKVAKQRCVALCGQLGWDAPDHNSAEAAGIWLYAGAQLDPQHCTRHEPLFLQGRAA